MTHKKQQVTVPDPVEDLGPETLADVMKHENMGRWYEVEVRFRDGDTSRYVGVLAQVGTSPRFHLISVDGNRVTSRPEEAIITRRFNAETTLTEATR